MLPLNTPALVAFLRWALLASLLMLLLLPASAAEPPAPPVIKLGVMWQGAKAASDEFRKYHAFAVDLRKEGVEVALIDRALFLDPKVPAEVTYRAMKQFHVVYIHQIEDGVGSFTPGVQEAAKRKGEAIARFVSEGGGLLLGPSVVRYIGADDQKYWNLLYRPLQMSALLEGLVDKTRTLKTRTEWLFDTSFWYTKNIISHPVTAGIGSIGHLTGELLAMASGIEMTHIPYKSAVLAFPEVINGSITLAIDTLPSVMQFLRAGSVRPLAMLSLERVATAPASPRLVFQRRCLNSGPPCTRRLTCPRRSRSALRRLSHESLRSPRCVFAWKASVPSPGRSAGPRLMHGHVSTATASARSSKPLESRRNSAIADPSPIQRSIRGGAGLLDQYRPAGSVLAHAPAQ